MQTLFHHSDQAARAPLAERMRPRTLDEIVGQAALLGPDGALRRSVVQDRVPSMILWGPPGSGKTTLAKVIASQTQARSVELSAVMSGVAEIRQAVKLAETRRLAGERTVVFVDEIHRFNKAQQDALLPHVERGTITLIGATTENPSFEVNAALLSRCKVFVLERLSSADVQRILEQAIHDPERGYGGERIEGLAEVVPFLVRVADGDARQALNALELTVEQASPDARGRRVVDIASAKRALQRTHVVYDKQGEEHYNIISALHKSLRGSDADAALYWLGRMLEAGEDPLYVARRLVRFASEDIGLADPQALVQAVAAFQASHVIGMPECNVILAQAVAYLARAPKSNALYAAYNRVRQDIRELPNEPVPLHIRNAPTSLMKDLGYGQGYIYPPEAEGPIDQSYLPEALKGRKYLLE